jgi:hypothetical protein
MAHGDLFDQSLEYALGTFNTQRNSLRPFNNRQDFEAFLNFKPFYDWEVDFPLRNLQFGGSVDVGSENELPVPALLRTNQSEGAPRLKAPRPAAPPAYRSWRLAQTCASGGFGRFGRHTWPTIAGGCRW